MLNLVPGQYRGVAVARPGCGLDPGSLRAHFLGREAYRRTRFIVVHGDGGTALIRVRKESDAPLFSPIVSVEVLAGPRECAFVHQPGADTAVPSVLAEVARSRAPAAKAVVVQGLYEHVSFIVDPRPLRVRVREVVPPKPAKLYDQARRVLLTAEDLPPIELVPEVIDLRDVAPEHALVPCRGSGIPGASYLDERPPLRPWTLLGCERSQQIHRWFYHQDPPTIDVCPLGTADRKGPLLLTKCCLQEERIEVGDGWVSVPWGSTLDQVRAGIASLARQGEPSWQRV